MTSKDQFSQVPLIKYLRQNSAYSRRMLLNKILEGCVKVNQIITLDSQVLVSQNDKIMLDNQIVHIEKHLYYKFNKPLNVISTFNDPNGRYDLQMYLKRFKLNPTLKPIGRLDRHSTGLLLFSNDGEFIQTILHPKFSVPKEYEIMIDRPLNASDQTKMAAGFFLDDGPVKITFKEIFSPTHFIVMITIGRNRILRRSFEYFNSKIIKLHRQSIGAIDLGTLKTGLFEPIPAKDAKKLVLNKRSW